MQQLLKGKSAFITGGTAGIGKEIALLFARQGADVAIVGTSRERAEEVVKELESVKQDPVQKILFFLIDVSKTNEVEGIVQKLIADWGKVDILVNNAGITRDQLLLRMSEEEWDQVLAVNLKSVYNTCRALYRPMMKARTGSVINITSVIGLTGNVGQANYAASKAGMIGFTKSLAKELAGRGIRANCIAPGYIETPMTEKLPANVKEEVLKKIPLGRIGQPRDIAQAALYLASDLASYVTGQVFAVDGGMVM
ncbi:MAG: 3-oxoacyl-[acyl-carrier-protein] reductase [Verrucomicrobia bacterium RIFCSPHIGHO2_12_FULL_41_10]|nr:MAG: 3-oxoacyl-[acyl-carrier-protein] reductase [Verrucomicrobia bacterium RIFCSPHIGHO2_12_FULL_41_10]